MRLILFLALRQLWDRKLLNSIALLGVSLGVLVLIAMNGIMQGFQMKFKGEILRVSPYVTVYDRQIGASDVPAVGSAVQGPTALEVMHLQPADKSARIKQPFVWVDILQSMPEVEAACPVLAGQVILQRGTQERGMDLRGILPTKQDACTPISGYVQEGDWTGLSTTMNSIALGTAAAEKLGARLGDTLRIKGQDVVLKIVALYDSGIPPVDQTRGYVHLSTAQRVLRRPQEVSRLEVRLKDAEESNQMAQRFERLLQYESESWQKANANFLGLFAIQNMIVWMVVGAILIVGGFGILAIQIMIVLQKTKDISILRSVGFRRSDILWLFLIQGAIVSLLGALLGDLLGWRIVEFLGQLQIKQEGLVKSNTFLVYKDPRMYGFGILFAMVTGIFASLLPALRGSKVEPVDVLRGQVG